MRLALWRAESIYLVSEEKTGTRHVKMAIIDNQTKIMRKVEEQEIEKFASKARETSIRGEQTNHRRTSLILVC